MYINKIENRITFKTNTRYYLELLILATMELIGRNKSKITKHQNGKNVPHLETNEVVLVHCNFVNDNYQQNSRVLLTFVLNKSFAKLSEFSHTEIRFNGRNSNVLDIEDKINIPLVINQSKTNKK